MMPCVGVEGLAACLQYVVGRDTLYCACSEAAFYRTRYLPSQFVSSPVAQPSTGNVQSSSLHIKCPAFVSK